MDPVGRVDQSRDGLETCANGPSGLRVSPLANSIGGGLGRLAGGERIESGAEGKIFDFYDG